MYYIINLEYQLQLQCQSYPLVNSQIVLVYYYTTKSSAMQCASKIMKKVEKAPFMLMERSQQKISLPSKSLVRQLFLYTSYNSNTPILLYMWDMILQYSSEQDSDFCQIWQKMFRLKSAATMYYCYCISATTFQLQY